jgi:hypothetical protein
MLKRWLLLLVALLASSSTLDAGVVTESGPRYFTAGGAGGGNATGFTANSGFSSSGDCSDGSTTCTVSRNSGDFGVKPNGAKPASYFAFYSGNSTSDTTHARQSNGSVVGTVSSGATQKAPNSTQACVATHSSFIGGSCAFHTLSTPGTKSYSFNKVYSTLDRVGGNSVNNWKVGRINPSGGGQNRWYWGDGTGNTGLLVESNAGGTLNSYDEFGAQSWWTMPISQNQWDVLEVKFQESSFDTADGDMEVSRNGKTYRTLGTHLFMNRETAAMSGQHHASHHLFEVDVGFSSSRQVFADYQVFDDSWYHCLIVDTSLYQSTTPAALGAEYLVATVWNATITMTVRAGSFASLSGKHMQCWVDNTMYDVGTWN